MLITYDIFYINFLLRKFNKIYIRHARHVSNRSHLKTSLFHAAYLRMHVCFNIKTYRQNL